jgi:exodeoxyribonuclease VII small subunit
MTAKPRPEEPPAADFEQSLRTLEEMVARLERGDLPLNDALALFEQGVQMTRQCHGQLSAAQQRVEILLKDGASERIEPFSPAAGTGGD